MLPGLHLVPCLLLAAAPVLAEVSVHFEDSSPDWFTIRNGSACELGPFELVIDLGTSAAGLIFDVTGAGAGFAGWGPLTVVAGGEQVLAISELSDGDSRLVVELEFLAGGGTVQIAVDVDDTSGHSEYTRTIVSPAEIAGAIVHVLRGGAAPPVTATFGPDGAAILPLEACIA